MFLHVTQIVQLYLGKRQLAPGELAQLVRLFGCHGTNGFLAPVAALFQVASNSSRV
jgi:hypothetical protein